MKRERKAAPAPPDPRIHSGKSSWWTYPTSCEDSDGGRCYPSCWCGGSLWNWIIQHGLWGKPHQTRKTNFDKSHTSNRQLELIVFSVIWSSEVVSSVVTLPVRIHADLSFDCDVLSRAQSFEYTTFVRKALEGDDWIISLYYDPQVIFQLSDET